MALATRILTALLILVSASADAQFKYENALIEIIDSSVEPESPGVAVGVFTDDRIAFTHYAGLANLESSTPIDANSRFNIASNAKQFTALMILELVEQGLIDLDADFREYLPEAMPGITQPISVKSLLTHTSGVRDLYDLIAMTGVTWYERPLDNGDAMDLLNRQVELNFPVASEYQYSNSNYILLAEVIEAISETRFNEYANAFFARLKMDGTVVRRRYGEVVPNVARAYGKWSGWLEDPSIANTFGDGFLYTTLQDQLAWEAQVWGGESTLQSDLIARSQQPIDGVSATDDYGYGLEFGNFRGLATTFHIGSTGGYNAYTLRFPSLKATVVVMANSGAIDVVGLGQRVASVVFEGQFPSETSYPPEPAEVGSSVAIERFEGPYELDSGTFIRLVVRDGALFREISGAEPVRMVPERGNLFHYESNPDLKLALFEASDGLRSFGIYAPFQAPQFATPLTEAPVGEDYRLRLQGTFVNSETDTEITLEYLDGDAFAMIKNGRRREATLVGKNYLAWNAYRFRVVFDDSGYAGSLVVDRGRIRNVVFQRVRTEEK